MKSRDQKYDKKYFNDQKVWKKSLGAKNKILENYRDHLLILI
jgi:hypothetical protein